MGTRRGCEQVLVQGAAQVCCRCRCSLLWTLRDQGRLIAFFTSLGRWIVLSPFYTWDSFYDWTFNHMKWKINCQCLNYQTLKI